MASRIKEQLYYLHMHKGVSDRSMAGISDEQYVIDSQGRKKGVILSIERYERMTEDLHDLAIVAERRDEGTVSFEEMKRRLEQDGLL